MTPHRASQCHLTPTFFPPAELNAKDVSAAQRQKLYRNRQRRANGGGRGLTGLMLSGLVRIVLFGAAFGATQLALAHGPPKGHIAKVRKPGVVMGAWSMGWPPND